MAGLLTIISGFSNVGKGDIQGIDADFEDTTDTSNTAAYIFIGLFTAAIGFGAYKVFSK